MELLIGAAVVATLLMKVWSTAKVDQEFAKQGKPSPRMEAKYGQAEAARRVARYGFTDFLRDAYNDYWPRRTDALIAARNAKAANPKVKVSWRARIAAAMASVDTAVKAGYAKTRAAFTPQAAPAPKPRDPEPPAAPLATESGDVEPGTIRFGDNGRERWNGSAWEPAPDEPAIPAAPASTPATPTSSAASNPPAQEGTPTVTAPTGEAVNYETTEAELEAQIREQQAHLDQCIAAEQAAENLAGAVDGMQSTYRDLSTAAANTHDHLAAQNLDSTTLANTGATADALPPGRVNEMLDHVEQVKAVAAERRAAAEAALAATQAALDHLRRTYGDANETVAGNLGGDASFLNSGGGVTSTPVPDRTSDELYGRQPRGGDGAAAQPAVNSAGVSENGPAHSRISVGVESRTPAEREAAYADRVADYRN